MHVLMVNPRNAKGRFVKGHKKKSAKAIHAKAAKKSKKKHAKKSSSGRVIKGPANTTGHVIVVDRGARSGLMAAPKGVYTVNPKKKGPKKSKAHHAAAKKHKPTYHRNPKGLGGMLSFFKDTLTPALAFPAGALANDLVFGLLPLPAQIKAGNARILGKLGTASLLGIGLSFVLPRRLAALITGGMLGGVLYEHGKSFLKTQWPNLPLAGVSEYPSMEYESGMGQVPAFLGEAPSFLGAYAETSAVPMSGYVQQMSRY